MNARKLTKSISGLLISVHIMYIWGKNSEKKDFKTYDEIREQLNSSNFTFTLDEFLIHDNIVVEKKYSCLGKPQKKFSS